MRLATRRGIVVINKVKPRNAPGEHRLGLHDPLEAVVTFDWQHERPSAPDVAGRRGRIRRRGIDHHSVDGTDLANVPNPAGCIPDDEGKHRHQDRCPQTKPRPFGRIHEMRLAGALDNVRTPRSRGKRYGNSAMPPDAPRPAGRPRLPANVRGLHRPRCFGQRILRDAESGWRQSQPSSMTGTRLRPWRWPITLSYVDPASHGRGPWKPMPCPRARTC